MSLREFAEMAEQIKCQEQEVEKAKAQMQSTAEIPEPSMLPDIGAILQGVGVVLSPEQAEAVTRSFQAQVVGVGLPPAGRDAHMPEDTAMPQQEQPLVDARLVAQLREELASTKQALAQAVAEVNVARSASALPPPVEVEPPNPAGGARSDEVKISPAEGVPGTAAKKAKVSKSPEKRRSRSPKKQPGGEAEAAHKEQQE